MNRHVDMAGLRTSDVIMDLAGRQHEGQTLDWAAGYDQRAWLRAKLLVRHECPDVLVLGSSTLGGLTHEMFPGRSFLNGWLSAPTVEDFEAFTTILERAQCAPRQIVMGLDPWLVERSYDDQRWITLFSEYLEYHQRHDSVAARHVFHATAEYARMTWSEFKESLNYATTRGSLKALVYGRAEGARPRLVDMDIETFCRDVAPKNFHALRANDGHFEFCESYRLTPAKVREAGQNYLIAGQYKNWPLVDQPVAQRLEKVLQLWKSRGSRILFLAPPYNPLAYAAIRADSTVSRDLDLMDEYFVAMSKRLGSPFVRLRNPADAGCRQDEYEDSLHFRTTCFRKVMGVVSPYLKSDHG